MNNINTDHSHDHSHNHDSHGHSHHGHHHTPKSFNLAFLIAITLNLGFTIFEVIYAFLSNSMGLLADAAHNFGDVFGLVLAWGANWLLSLPARKRYTYGFKRTTILAAVANALILVSTSALIAYESLYKLFNLSTVNEQLIIIVALVGILINGGTALLFMKGAHDDLNIKGAFIHLLSDAVIAIGVVIAGVAIHYTGKMWIDPVTGLLIVVTILWGTWGLLRDSVRLILDAIPHYIDHSGVNTYLHSLPDVIAVHDLHIWGLSTKEVALTVHLVVASDHASQINYRMINATLKEKFKIHHATIQVEVGNGDYICVQSETC
jgi:cobalt-zinc-cadmium efflux system protein